MRVRVVIISFFFNHLLFGSLPTSFTLAVGSANSASMLANQVQKLVAVSN